MKAKIDSTQISVSFENSIVNPDKTVYIFFFL